MTDFGSKQHRESVQANFGSNQQRETSMAISLDRIAISLEKIVEMVERAMEDKEGTDHE